MKDGQPQHVSEKDFRLITAKIQGVNEKLQNAEAFNQA